MSQAVQEEKQESHSHFGNVKLTFGKHKDSTFEHVLTTDRSYCFYFVNNYDETQTQPDECGKQFYDYINSFLISNKETQAKMKQLIKKYDLKTPPSLLSKVFWVHSYPKDMKQSDNDPKKVGKWMLFFDKKFVLPNVITTNTEAIQTHKNQTNNKNDSKQNNNNNNNSDNSNGNPDEKKNETDNTDNTNNINNNNEKVMGMITELDQAWCRVVRLMSEGLLGCISAKCSTNASNPNARKGSTDGVIIIYTKDYSDKQDCLNVAQNIRKYFPEYKQVIRYKADFQTIQAKYSKRGNKSSIYIHTIDKPDQLQEA